MSPSHRSFPVDLLSKLGVPILAATLVGCVLREEVRLVHFVLMAVGLGLVYFGHRVDHHSQRG